MASNKIDLLGTTKLNKIEIPELDTVQGNNAVQKDVGLSVNQFAANGWAIQSNPKSCFGNGEIVNYISDCEGMPKADGIGGVFNDLIQKLGYVPKQEMPQVLPIPVTPTEPTLQQVKNHAVEYLNGDIAKAQKMFWDKNRNQGVISDVYSWGKDLFDTEFSKSRVGRILASEQLGTSLLTRASNYQLTQKDYFEAKLDFAMNILPKDNYSKAQIQYLQKSLAALTPEELNSFITAVATCNDEQYANEVPKAMNNMIANEQKLDYQPMDSAIKNVRFENPNSIGSLIKSHDNQFILMDFEEVFLRERETSYKPEAIKDYTEKEAQMNLILSMRAKNQEIKDLLHNATVTVDGNNKYGAPYASAIEPCRKNLERTLSLAYQKLYGEDAPKLEYTDSYSLVRASKELQAKLDENYNKVLNGKDFEDYQTEYSNAYKATYGDNNGTALAESFIESQMKGIQYIKTGVQGVGMIVMIAGQCIPVGGQVAAGLTFGGLTTATVGGSAVQLTEDLTKAGGITDDDKRAIVQELTTSIALMASGMGIGKVSTLAYGELVALNCPRLLSLAGKVGVDATMSMVATQAITGQIDLTAETISQLIPIITGVLRARGLKGYINNDLVSPNQVKSSFKDGEVTHPITSKIKEIVELHKDNPKKLDWLQDWTLDKTDYQNMARMMNMFDGKYAQIWKSTNIGDDIPNMQKLAVLEKVLKRNNALDDFSKIAESEWDIVVSSVTKAKSIDEFNALLMYKISSNFYNPALSNKSLMTPEIQTRINTLTKFLDNSVIEKGITVYRGEGYNGILNNYKTNDGLQIGKAMEELVAKSAHKNEFLDFIDKELMDLQLTQERFLSTALTREIALDWAHYGAAKLAKIEFNNGAIYWEITCPPKTKGSFIEDFNLMRTEKQNELLVQRNSILDIKNVEFDEKNKTWIIKANLIQNQLTIQAKYTIINAKEFLYGYKNISKIYEVFFKKCGE